MKEKQLKEKFVSFYSKFDSRLRKINREKISVKKMPNGYYLSCKYYRCEYGQFFGEDAV